MSHQCENGWILSEAVTMSRCEECAKVRRLETWIMSIAPRRFRGATLDDLTQPASVKEALLEWLHPDFFGDGSSLLLFGPVGSGKTFAAYAALRELHLKDWTVKATSAVMMFHSLQPDGGAVLGDYIQPEVLLIDDLGLEKASEWTDQQLTAIVDQRWRDCRSTIVTTNLTAKQLEQQIGRRAYDRLADGATALSLTRQSQRSRRAA